MCGIVGYLGKQNAVQPVLDGLTALEYRGYDSAGVAYLQGNQATLTKQVGRVEALEKLLEGKAGDSKIHAAIGHTRWATHGTPSVGNAHPHSNGEGTIFVVHNGIIENYVELKAKLKKKHYVFASDTDTEVIPHLIDHYYNELQDLGKAFEKAIEELQGAYAIAMCSSIEPDSIYAARLSSPLVLGVGEDELYLASDPTAIMDKTKQVVFLDDYEIIKLHDGKYHIKNIREQMTVDRKHHELDFDVEQSQKGDCPHFMIKEIFDIPQTIRMASLGRVNSATNTIKLGGLETVTEQLQHIDRIIIVASGTASFAGFLGEYMIEELAGIPVEVQVGSEFKYKNEPLSRGTALIVISQSGETADTIAALKKTEKYGVLRLGIVNAVGSTIARMTDAGVYCHAGPEKAVASTKAYIAMSVILLQIALLLGRERSPLYTKLLKEIEDLPFKAEAVLAQADKVQAIARKYAHYKDFFFLGRRYAFPSALEGALKLKECTLIHAEAFQGGEMKHGPLALIDKDFPSFTFAGDGPMLDKMISNIEEVRSRGGKVIAVATEGNKQVAGHADDVIYIPATLEQTEPILQGIVVQLFAYYIAVERDINVDRPRNLAKSVTVE